MNSHGFILYEKLIKICLYYKINIIYAKILDFIFYLIDNSINNFVYINKILILYKPKYKCILYKKIPNVNIKQNCLHKKSFFVFLLVLLYADIKRSKLVMVDYAFISSSNIRFLLTENNLSVRQLADIIGIAATTLNDSLKSKKGVSISSLIKIADYFNVSVNDLCSEGLKNKFELNSQNNELIKKFNKLDERGKQTVINVIDQQLNFINYK